MPQPKVLHAFTNDVLARHDAVALAQLLRRRDVSEAEVHQAAAARARAVAGRLGALAVDMLDRPLGAPVRDDRAPFAGVPTFLKDTVDIKGQPTRMGSRAISDTPAGRHSVVTRKLLEQGFNILGKTRLPEFGFSATTEFEHDAPTCNPYNLAHTSGGSSGGTAALVAAGVVPMAHGNDGGGSIRIPSACCGLVGLKPSRGRWVAGEAFDAMPVKIGSEGMLSRSVRDSAHFMAAAERQGGSRGLPPIGLVEGPGNRRLRIALVLDSVGDVESCPETRATVETVARDLERLGHHIEPMKQPPVPEFFIQDFKLYWAFIASMVQHLGRFRFPGFDAKKLDPLTRGLARYHRQRALKTPLAMARLQGSSLAYALQMRRFDAVLSPVLTRPAPPLGYLSPSVEFDELFERIARWSAFTPLNNATGSPGISVPGGMSTEGLPIGVHFSGRHGDERTLLELAYALEAERPFPRL